MTAWMKAEQAVVRYRPASVEEVVNLLSLAGRVSTSKDKQPCLEIDETNYRTIVRNCTALLQGAHRSATLVPAQDVDEQTVSALALLDENIQPISAEPDLRAELNRLASEQDVGGWIALFDMYIAAADAMLSIQNQP